MNIAILTIFPEMLEGPLSASILGRARAAGLLAVEAVDIRPYSVQKHKNTDDYPFGGGAGMVMTAQPIVDAVEALRARGNTLLKAGRDPRRHGWNRVENLLWALRNLPYDESFHVHLAGPRRNRHACRDGRAQFDDHRAGAFPEWSVRRHGAHGDRPDQRKHPPFAGAEGEHGAAVE